MNPSHIDNLLDFIGDTWAFGGALVLLTLMALRGLYRCCFTGKSRRLGS